MQKKNHIHPVVRSRVVFKKHCRIEGLWSYDISYCFSPSMSKPKIRDKIRRIWWFGVSGLKKTAAGGQ
jgi:hypothetical protein